MIISVVKPVQRDAMHRLTFLAGGCAASGAATFFSLKPVFAASESENKNKIKLSELPIYDTSDVSPQRFEVEAEKISPLRSYVRDTRIVIWKYLDSVEDKANSVSDKFRTAKAHTESFLSYLHEDSSVVARAAIITVAGLGGIVAGYRGGIVKKAFYSSLLASGAATICYPKEASELFNKGWGTIKEKSTDVLFPDNSKTDSPTKVSEEHDKKKNVCEELGCEDQVEAQIKLTSLTSSTRKDFGMSKPEDKDLYANRSD